MKYFYLCIFLLIGFLSTGQNLDSNSYLLTADQKVVALYGQHKVLLDSTQKYSKDDVLSGAFDSLFLFPQNDLKPGSNYWINFELRGLDSIRDRWLILTRMDDDEEYLHYAQNEYVDVYKLDGQGTLLDHQKSGIHVPMSEKSIEDQPGVNRVNLSLDPDQSYSFYIHIRNEYSLPELVDGLEVRHMSRPILLHKNVSIFYSAKAITLVFGIMALFFFFYLRDPSFLWFSIYLLLLSAHYLILDYSLPFISLFIPEHPYLVHFFWSFLTMSSFLAFLLFGRYFIELWKLSPKLDQWYKGLLLLVGLMLIISSISSFLLANNPLLGFGLLAMVVITLGFVIRLAFFKDTLTRFFTFGAIWLFFFQLVGIFWNMEMFDLPFNPWSTAQIGQIIIYSMGLAYKFRTIEKDRAEAEQIVEMDKIKSNFFANISHEFRTPLTLIQAPLSEAENLNGRGQSNAYVKIPTRHFASMRRNTDRLLELVNQLLDLSRLDSGKVELQVIKGDIMQFLRHLTYSFESATERKQIHFRTSFSEESYVGFYDKDKLQKIFTNLLSNAIKYTPKKGTVSVNVQVVDNRLKFIIDDSGPGIPKDELDKIFQRYYRMEGQEEHGSGIGLALVKELVDLYRGQIHVDSSEEKGTEFSISLPVKASAFSKEEIMEGLVYHEKTHSAPQFENIETDKIVKPELNQDSIETLQFRILVVEDNTELRSFMKESLSKQYDIIEAENGRKGFELAVEEVPDLIISDVMMPKMNGFELCKRIKNDERTSHIPLILLTAKADHQHKLDGLDIGADDYLTKPFDKRELLSRIRNLIRLRRQLRLKFAEQVQLMPKATEESSKEEQFLSKVMKAIEHHLDDESFGVEDLAAHLAMSRSQLHRKLTALIGQSPSSLIRKTRLLKAKQLLEKKVGSPSEIAFKVGFNSHSYFSKCFKDEFGLSPGEVEK